MQLFRDREERLGLVDIHQLPPLLRFEHHRGTQFILDRA